MRRALLACALVAPAAAAQTTWQPEHDNVLLIVADDVGLDRVEAFGRSPTSGPTPVLDLVADYGVRFERAYAAPVCSPSRASLLTGRFGYRTGVGTNITFDGGDAFELSPDELTLADALAPTHRTGAVGKWHLGTRLGSGYRHPVRCGFEVFTGSKEQLGGIYSPPGAYFGWEKSVASPQGDVQYGATAYSTTDHVDDALAVIDWFGPAPWFVQVSFNAAHTPFHVPPDDLTTIKATGASIEAIKHRAMVEAMDREIERLLLGIPRPVLRHTWIIFVADNGTHGQAVSDKDLEFKSKGTLYEGGIGVPLIIVGPDVVGLGRSVDSPVNTTDLFATILDMAGVELPEDERPEDSVSLMPLLLDPSHPPVREHAYAEFFEPNGPGPWTRTERAIVGDRYKLLELVDAGGARLLAMFDLLQDPKESVNLLAEGIPYPLIGVYTELLSALGQHTPDVPQPPHDGPTGARLDY